MSALLLKIVDSNWNTIAESHGDNEIYLVNERVYQPGDRIILETEEKNIPLWLQFDDALGKSLVYITDRVVYEIPFGEKRINLSPKVFYGELHLLYARVARDYEIKAYRNLALNVNDQHGDTNCYPHATANVETRGESVFAAKNAIDGVVANSSHGKWPFQSWGINRQDDAAMRIDFGRKVLADQIILYTRADFPHDNWWEEVTFTFSDGSSMTVTMKKSSLPHVFDFGKRKINWIEISDLIKSEEESPFPALTQMEVYGVDLID